MSAYRGRTGPNFSQYLSDLNQLSPPDQQFLEDNDFSNDLAMYTNTDFTNLDMPGLGDEGTFNFDLSAEDQGPDSIKYEELLGGAGNSTDFGTVAPIPSVTAPQQTSLYSTYNTPIQPAPSGGFPMVDHTNQNTTSQDGRGQRMNTVQPVEQLSVEDKSKIAAEEDKRRRNTAASARFRVKKKQREQALEKTLKDAQDKNSKLESRIGQLEMENKWLKDLITEKNGLQSKEEMAAAYEQHRKASEERDSKNEPVHATGVGTD